MLAIPEYANRLRLISLDPGTTFTGLACFEIDLANMQIEVVDALVIKASTNFGHYKEISLLHGDRLARIMNICDTLLYYLNTFNPQMVISEGPYMGQHVTAFEGLVHCLSYFEMTVMNYNNQMPLEVIDPTTVKRNLNAILRGEESKNSVREKVLELQQTRAFSTNINIELLGEHAIDAVAVGWYKFCQLKEFAYAQRYCYHKNDYRSFNSGTLNRR